MERVLLEHRAGHMEKKVITNSQCGFTKNSLTACYDEMTGSEDGERAVDVTSAGFMLKGGAVVMGETEAEGKDRRETLRNSMGTTIKSCTWE